MIFLYGSIALQYSLNIALSGDSLVNFILASEKNMLYTNNGEPINMLSTQDDLIAYRVYLFNPC